MIKGVETVRPGAPDLPLLAPWEPQQGPLILGDWLLIIEPIICECVVEDFGGSSQIMVQGSYGPVSS